MGCKHPGHWHGNFAFDIHNCRLHCHASMWTASAYICIKYVWFEWFSFHFSWTFRFICSSFHAHRYRMWFFNAWLWTLLAIQIQIRCYGHTTAPMVPSHLHFYIHDLLYDWVSHCSVGDDRRIVPAEGMRIDLMAIQNDSFNCNFNSIQFHSRFVVSSAAWQRLRHTHLFLLSLKHIHHWKNCSITTEHFYFMHPFRLSVSFIRFSMKTIFYFVVLTLQSNSLLLFHRYRFLLFLFAGNKGKNITRNWRLFLRANRNIENGKKTGSTIEFQH